MSLHTVISGIKVAPLTHQETSPRREGKERRATHRASADWQSACGDEETPDLIGLGVGEATGGWHDRFLIRSDEHMPHAVFIACGSSLQSDWQMDRLGDTVENTLPTALCGRFAEGCQRSLEEGCPVPVEGCYRDEDDREVLFRCVLMPVRAVSDDVDFVYGAYSHKIAA